MKEKKFKVCGEQVVRFCIEEHTGGREGLGKGARTGEQKTFSDALKTICEIIAAGNAYTCIARNARGEGKELRVSLIDGRIGK